MPIKPENRSRYPKNWKQIRAAILERAGNRCEFCGVENYSMRLNPKTGKEVKIILTIAHLDHTPENCDPSNLRALCQKCHNTYDAEHRKETRKNKMNMDKRNIVKALDAFEDRLKYYNNYREHQISSQESICRIAQDLEPDVLEVIVKALRQELDQ